jgi:micrococcal nuclease
MLSALARIALLVCWSALSVSAQLVATPEVFEGSVVSIKDGDTIGVLYDGKEVKVRLAHIDCPESGQPFGQAAKKFTSDFCYRKTARIVQADRPDRYGRLIGLVYVDEKCLSIELVEGGLAWHFLKYSKEQSYSELELLARKKGKGLWSDSNPIPPWDWRKGIR